MFQSKGAETSGGTGREISLPALAVHTETVLMNPLILPSSSLEISHSP